MSADEYEQQPSQDEGRRRPVDIPASAREVKARFLDEPDRTLVLAIAKYVSETGEAHTHPSVTYTPVTRDCEVRYLQDFELHERFHADEDHWCVCAACPHDYPQFKKHGMIVWLPQEGTIKIIGGDCFKRLNPEAHARAEARWKADREQRSNEEYLLARLWQVPILADAIKHDLAIARAFDRVRTDFHVAIVKERLEELSRHVTGDKLIKLTRVIRNTHGTGSRQSITTREVYAEIKGATEFFDRAASSFSKRLATVEKALQPLNFGADWQSAVLDMSEDDKQEAARTVGATLMDWQEIRKRLDKCRDFIGQETGKTIENWSDLPGCPYPMFFEFAEEKIRIGLTPTRNTVVLLPLAAREPLSVLPTLSPDRKN